MADASPRLTVVDPAESPELAAVYEQLEGDWPFVPNWFHALSTRPDLILANARFSNALVTRGMLPTALKQLVITALSIQFNCNYCTAAHRAMARQAGVTEEVIQGLMKGLNTSKLPPTQRAIVEFALACSTDPKSLQDPDFEKLRELGLEDGEIAEVVLLVGFTRHINTWSDAAGIEIDEILRT